MAYIESISCESASSLTCNIHDFLLCCIILATYDPGWNDPPPMPVAGAEVNKPTKTKLNLNKRIAFPMAGSGGSPSTSSNVKTTAEGLPLPFSTAKYQTPPSVFQPAPSAPEATPVPLLLPPPVAIPVASTPPAATEDSLDSSTTREFCQLVFGRLSDAMALKLDAGKMTEIRKRLDILNGVWLEDKLDRSTQIDLYNIAKGNWVLERFESTEFSSNKYCIPALDDNNVESAKEQHRQLIVNHTNACHQWGTALRQIILSLDETYGEQSNHDGPAVLPENEVNVVQFLNVGSTAHVIDGVSPFPINPIEPIAPLELNASTSLPLSNIETANSIDDTLVQSNDEPRTSKSKSSRFGRILHI